LLQCVYCEQELTYKQATREYLCEYCNTSFAHDNGVYDFLRNESEKETRDFFPKDSYDLLFQLENNSFWFLGRNLLIKNIISNYLAPNSMILEIGCGTGFVSSYLKKSGYDSIDCSDVFQTAIRYCKERDAGNVYYLFDLKYCPFFEHYDGVCVFDVLEHIDDDELALKNLYQSVREEGFLFITVPASNLLWSEADVYLKHKRRYSREELIQKVEHAGFHVVRCTYFMSFLFPILYVGRRFEGTSDQNAAAVCSSSDRFVVRELKLNWVLNKIFSSTFSIEILLLKYRDFSFGSSLFCVAQKTAKTG
jgi:SAM-dependent methyltransferase